MRQNKLALYVHIVWATWDRLPLITEEIERDVYRYIEGVCHKHGCPVLAIGGMPDHIHILVSLTATITIADLVEYMKGGSSRHVSEAVEAAEWFKWQGSYGAFTVSPHEKQKVTRYILNQKQHHADGRPAEGSTAVGFSLPLPVWRLNNGSRLQTTVAR